MLRAALTAIALCGSTTLAQSCFPPVAFWRGLSLPCAGWYAQASMTGCTLHLSVSSGSNSVSTILYVFGVSPLGLQLPPPFVANCVLIHDPLVIISGTWPTTAVPLPRAPVPSGTNVYLTALLEHPSSTGTFWSASDVLRVIW